ncbi:dehydrogenase/reductase SDR family member 7 isoform 1-T1 [Alca torda]
MRRHTYCAAAAASSHLRVRAAGAGRGSGSPLNLSRLVAGARPKNQTNTITTKTLLFQGKKFGRDTQMPGLGELRRRNTGGREAIRENELRGKVVWVTGASSGIGEELAYQLSKIGALLAISARREDELQRVKKKCLQISNLSEKDIFVLRLDLTDRSSHEAATNSVLKHFGKIDVLVNNGGRSQRSLFVDTNLDVYSAIIELNYLGTISLTKHVLNHMIQRKKGKIVTVSSVMGIMGAPLASGYCASKHALQGFFNSLRTELTDYPEISIINICPGPVQSQIIQNVFTENLSKSIENSGDQSHKMPTDRCVRLTLVSTANDLKEAWISDHPYLAVCYLWQYAPTWAWWLMNRMGKRRIQNFKSGVDADASYSRKKK